MIWLYASGAIAIAGYIGFLHWRIARLKTKIVKIMGNIDLESRARASVLGKSDEELAELANRRSSGT